MEQTKNVEVLNQLIFECIERIARFSSHLEEIKKQFYNDEDSIVTDKLMFINSYEECLIKYFEIILAYQEIINGETEVDTLRIILKLELILKSINDLHLNHLIHLPRPNEPMELRRFGRVIKKQIFNIDEETHNSVNPISIYINEQIGEVTYSTDPLQDFKLDKINTLVSDLSLSFNDIITNKVNECLQNNKDAQNAPMHITISRIDANNPSHWPSLLHEVSHTLMNKIKFTNGNIYEDFIAYLKEVKSEKYIEEIKLQEIDVRHWLNECWCDLIACASIGPSFYFSQYHLFLNYLEINANRNYPPYIFRLKLIEKLLYHRFKNIVQEEKFENDIALSQKVMDFFERNQKFHYKTDSFIRKLFSLFKEYFLDHLFKTDSSGQNEFINTEFNAKFNKTIRYVNEISPARIEALSKNLEKGYPIPSFIESQEPYHEKPTSVQEIFFAAWKYKNGAFKNHILNTTLKLKGEIDLSNIEELTKAFTTTICKEGFNRFDQSVLRSIQVSEWFDALYDNDTDKDVIKDLQTAQVEGTSIDNVNGLLVDREILNCVKEEEILIIPLMSLRDQGGSASMDIRLGTTFELYLPNQFGILDFTEAESLKKIAHSAQRINLDFPESIAINPGQFILGHSMEYIVLGKNIVADLEGRSSFARLGIEIHMTAGFIDPGFKGVLTFELFNAGPSPVKLYPGIRIGQLRFTRVNQPSKTYGKSAKYGGLLEYYGSKQNSDGEVSKLAKIKKALNYKS
ncbi:MAG: dCTP deaminase [Ferruginibacter sp.]